MSGNETRKLQALREIEHKVQAQWARDKAFDVDAPAHLVRPSAAHVARRCRPSCAAQTAPPARLAVRPDRPRCAAAACTAVWAVTWDLRALRGSSCAPAQR